MPIKITRLDKVLIPAYSGPTASEFAQIAPETVEEEQQTKELETTEK